MKKILTSLLLLFGVTLGSANVFAEEISDVDDGYWASKEIHSVVNDKVMSLYDGSLFRPELNIKRAEFNSALLRALNHSVDSVDVSQFKSSFKDMQESHWAYTDVVKSEKLGLVYGYPDNTFRPDNEITKSEAESILSHITKDDNADTSVLNNFKDGDTVPAWDQQQYAKMIKYGIYVNHPDEDILLPNNHLNRAETAVLLYKLREKLGFVKGQYLPENKAEEQPVDTEYVIATEYLNEYANAPVNEVMITNKRNVIKAGNVLAPTYIVPFNSKKFNEGDKLRFDILNDVKTTEGTLVIPAGSIVTATISSIKAPKVFNKSAEVTLQFNELMLPSKQSVDFPAKVAIGDGVLRPSKAQKIAKVAYYTLGGTALGSGIGVAAGASDNIGKGIAIGAPVGAGVGLATGLITPGVSYKAKQGSVIYIELTDDVSIYSSDL